MSTLQKKQILLSISGNNRPEATRQIIEWLVAQQLDILNIRQVVIQNQLSLMIWTAYSAEGNLDFLDFELKGRAAALGLDACLIPLTEQEIALSASAPDYILTLLAWELLGQMLVELIELVGGAGLSVDAVRQLSQATMPLDATPVDAGNHPRPVCVELSLRGRPENIDHLRALLLAFAGHSEVDIAFQRNDLFRRYRRLIVFDMDSTLIQNEVIDELASVAGVADKVSAITERAMNGELPFRESLVERVQLLAGLPVSKLEEVTERLTLTQGAKRLMRLLRQLGMRTAIISGGFQYFGRHIQKQLGIDYLYANDLDIEQGRLTGLLRGTVIDAQGKAEILKKIAHNEGLALRQTVAVGDGANDLPMLAAAGLGIAYHAKPRVKEAASQAISTHGLDGILYLLGIHDLELASLNQEPTT